MQKSTITTEAMIQKALELAGGALTGARAVGRSRAHEASTKRTRVPGTSRSAAPRAASIAKTMA